MKSSHASIQNFQDTSSKPFKGGLLGHPLGHSLSPKLFSILGSLFQRSVSYQLLEVPPPLSAIEKIPEFESLNFFNVTSPYKEKILPYLESKNFSVIQTPAVKALQACNFLERLTSETWKAWNTDWLALQNFLQIQGNSKNALVYGAGGASKACLYALGNLEIPHVWITNRTLEKAHQTRSQFQTLFSKTSWDVISFEKLPLFQEPLDWIFQTTSSERDSLASSLPLPKEAIQRETQILDLVYFPSESSTRFLKQCAALQKKSPSVGNWDGLDLLIRQALEAWALLTRESISGLLPFCKKIRKEMERQ